MRLLDMALLPAALLVSMVGGLVLAVDSVMSLPVVVVVTGGLLSVVGLVLSFLLGVREAKQRGTSLPREATIRLPGAHS